MTMPRFPKLILLGATLSLPLVSLAQPPAWAGNGKAKAAVEQDRYDHDRDRDRDYRHYRYTERERNALRRHLSRRDYQSLPPGLQKKVARGGDLPPGWKKKLQAGHRLPNDIYHHGQRLPVYDGIRQIHGVSDVVIDNEVVRVLDATQTIVDVFGIR
ncbi:MAG: hypothetical protein VX793_13565 [Pseudomonadota bacterium]|nr:hypothetical protein [Pseudomonadota bacterium]